jgi:CBS domain-containing membrane protein
MHPPGGATAVTCIVGGPAVYELGYLFLVIPVFFNSIIILSFALAAGTLREKNPYLKGE